MTGIYLRVQRDGRWLSVDIAEMTDDEIREAMAGRDARELANWVVALVGITRAALSGVRR